MTKPLTASEVRALIDDLLRKARMVINTAILSAVMRGGRPTHVTVELNLTKALADELRAQLYADDFAVDIKVHHFHLDTFVFTVIWHPSTFNPKYNFAKWSDQN